MKVLDKRQILFSVLNDATLDSLLKLQTRYAWLAGQFKEVFKRRTEQEHSMLWHISPWHVQHLIVMYRFLSVTQAKRTWIGRS